MKKLLILAMALVIASCGRNTGNRSDKNTQSPTANGTNTNNADAKSYTNITLNGMTKDSADKLIENYNNSPSLAMPAGTFFINKDLLRKVVKVLSEEQSKDASVDGVRIYFGRQSTKEAEVQLILVATRDYQPHTPQKTHDDYYDHKLPAADELYTPGNTDFGMPFFPKNSIKGTELYTKCTKDCSDDPACDFNKYPQFLRRATAEDMVGRYSTNAVRTKAEWFSLSTLQLMLSDPATTGIRAYMARRPVDPQRDDSDMDCLIFTTTKVVGSYYKDYFDCKTMIEEFERSHPVVPPPINNGELCPNNCN